MAEQIPALKAATDVLRLALVALDLALTKHPMDDYLQGQAREHVWRSYWELREAAGDSPSAVEEQRDQLQRDLDRLLEARRALSFAVSARAHYEALKELHEVAQEIEAGHREKEAPND